MIVASLGGFTTDAFVTPAEREAMYDRVAAGLARVDDSGVRLCAQTLPPYPWYMGGQLYCNLFVDPRDTAEFAEKHDRRLCFDVSHSKLSANYLGMSFGEATDLLAPHTEHLHLVDATGVDGEGVQVGDGEIDWAAARQAARRDVAGRELHPRDLAGPRQRRRGLLDRPRAAGAMVLTAPVALWVVPVSDLAGVARHVLDVARSGIPGWRLVFLTPPGDLPRELRAVGAEVVEGALRPGARPAVVRRGRCATSYAVSSRPSCTATWPTPTSSPRWSCADRGSSRPSTASPATTSSTTARARKGRVMALAHTARLRRFHAAIAVSRGDRRRDGREVAPARSR